MKIRAGNRRKSSIFKKIARKTGINSPSRKKGLPKKNRRGKKGNIKNYALRKKKGAPRKKNEGLSPFF